MPTGKFNREQAIYESLATLTSWSQHQGCLHIRPMIETFELARGNGDVHICLVHPPLQCTLFDFQRLGSTAASSPRALPEYLVKYVMKVLLEALDFLHTEANFTHCGMHKRR